MSATLLGRPHTFERGDKVYMTTPLRIVNPTEREVEEYAFASAARTKAPNENIGWLEGRYVEAGNPNRNGAMWLSNELALKALTPMLMPVTVMHDPRTAVGTIADTKLHSGEVSSRIDNVLAIWRHRFGDVWEEAAANVEQGTMMQSMECVPLRSEILTRRGWKRWDELREDDETVGFNPAANRNEWTRIKRVVRKRAEVVTLAHARWRADCTRGHRWLTQRLSRGVPVGEQEFVTTAALGTSRRLTLTAEASLQGWLPVSPAEARVIGWIAGDGSYRASKKAGQAVVYQSKPDGVMALELALADAGIPYTRRTREPSPSTRADGTVIAPSRSVNIYQLRGEEIALLWHRAELDHLSWTAFVLGLTDAARAAWLDAIYEAEGNENHGSRCIAQNPGPIKDAIALAAYLCGYRPSARIGGDNSQAASHVRLCREPVNSTALTTTSRGEGEVWCPVTDLGSWTMRQDGNIMLTGNCYAPWYCCADCNQQYVKLPNGAERASWCDHLRGNGSSPARRILGDVCFTGTGLIFGTRGGVGAYTEAYLDHFHDEIAEYHERSHAESTYKPNNRSTSHMGLVQIEDTELASLKRERDDARAEADKLKDEKRDLTTKVETAEAAQKSAEKKAEDAETQVTELTEKAQSSALKDKRIGALGDGFMAKLGETSKTVLNDLASKASDDEWDNALKEREELAGVKRDAKGDGSAAKPSETASKGASAFADEEVASFLGRISATETSATDNSVDSSIAVRSLARAFKPKSKAA